MLSIITRHIVFTLLGLLLATLAFPQRLPAIPTEIDFGGATVYMNADAQQRLQQEVTSLYADRSVLRNAIEQMQYIESVLGPMMEERSVPADFRYACLPANPANGSYWGLDARNATRLNLRVDNSVDERLNVASSSEAVLNEFVTLHTTYPNWLRVLLMYASGQRLNDMSAQPVEASLPNDQLQLPANSPALIWTALARKIVFEREIPLLRPNANPFLLYDYRQSRSKSLAAIARELGIEQARFMPFNDWLRVRIIPADKVYPVLIRLTPGEFLSVRGQVNSTVQLGQPSQPGIRRDMGFPVLRKTVAPSSSDPITRASAQFYEINDRKGVQAQTCDNVITLAHYGNITVDKFLSINDMTDKDLVRPGEIYYLETKARKAKIPFHVMQAGQTLREVATVYGIQMKSLLKYNHLEANQRLQPGRILWLREKRPSNVPAEYQVMPDPVPVSEPTVAQRKLTRENEESVIDSPSLPNWRIKPADSTTKATPDRVTDVSEPENERSTPGSATATQSTAQLLYYTVREGDTHSSVAERYNLPLADLMTWNNLSYRKALVVGQQLIVAKFIPAKSAETATPVAQPTAPATTTGATGAQPLTAPIAGPTSTERTIIPQTTPPTGRSREYTESAVDVERPVTPPPAPSPAPKPAPVTRPERLINRVRIETPKVNGRSYYHVVQRGQTVYRVALINKVRVQDVMRWNNLTSYTIEIGQRILIRK
ncbi:LysM peptidoglycan-binding domain-containing protein [Fibrella aquatica]|uniref:LysM peptidoglycan-binding domain-containing protein n=1 Tax=Fibrella aquatica TaxID=3242487 RepID=UPI0035219B7E